MANICCNDMTLTGPKSELERFRELFKKYDYEFTYRGIFEMPESLDIPASSEREMAMIYALYTMANGDIHNIPIKNFKKYDSYNYYGMIARNGRYSKDATQKLQELYNGIKKRIEHYPLLGTPCDKCPTGNENISTREELLKFGETILHNLLEYGYADWYGWSNAVWGVKWDAGEGGEVEIYDDCISLSFTSPWGPLDGVFAKIVEDFPQLTLVVEVDCEGAGYWTIHGENGKMWEDNFRDEEDYDEDYEDDECEEDSNEEDEK